jgi:hypothetical protein
VRVTPLSSQTTARPDGRHLVRKPSRNSDWQTVREPCRQGLWTVRKSRTAVVDTQSDGSGSPFRLPQRTLRLTCPWQRWGHFGPSLGPDEIVVPKQPSSRLEGIISSPPEVGPALTSGRAGRGRDNAWPAAEMAPSGGLIALRRRMASADRRVAGESIRYGAHGKCRYRVPKLMTHMRGDVSHETTEDTGPTRMGTRSLLPAKFRCVPYRRHGNRPTSTVGRR